MSLEILKVTPEMADEIGEIGFASWNAAYKDIVPKEFLMSFTPKKRADSLLQALSVRQEEYYLFKALGKAVGFSIIGGHRMRIYLKMRVKSTQFTSSQVYGAPGIRVIPCHFALKG